MTPELEREQGVLYGIRQGDCTEPIIEEVLKIYHHVVQGSGDGEMPRYANLASIYQSSVVDGKNSEWRLGSYLDPHSKLWITRVFYPEAAIKFYAMGNLGDVGPELEEEGRKMENEFRLAVEDFLLKNGLAIPIGRI